MKAKIGEFNLDFKAFGKNRECMVVYRLKTKWRKIRKELLEVSSHWVRVFRATDMCSGLYPRVGEHDI